MTNEIYAQRPDLVILGSEALSATFESRVPGGGGSGALTSGSMGMAGAGMGAPLGQGQLATSAALALAKSLTDVPLLIVKANAAGERARHSASLVFRMKGVCRMQG